VLPYHQCQRTTSFTLPWHQSSRAHHFSRARTTSERYAHHNAPSTQYRPRLLHLYTTFDASCRQCLLILLNRNTPRNCNQDHLSLILPPPPPPLSCTQPCPTHIAPASRMRCGCGVPWRVLSRLSITKQLPCHGRAHTSVTRRSQCVGC